MCNRQDQNTTAAAAQAAATKEKEATYLVIGAGTAGLSFIDSLLTLDANASHRHPCGSPFSTRWTLDQELSICAPPPGKLQLRCE